MAQADRRPEQELIDDESAQADEAEPAEEETPPWGGLGPESLAVASTQPGQFLKE
jgi:hypothetical protein